MIQFEILDVRYYKSEVSSEKIESLVLQKFVTALVNGCEERIYKTHSVYCVHRKSIRNIDYMEYYNPVPECLDTDDYLTEDMGRYMMVYDELSEADFYHIADKIRKRYAAFINQYRDNLKP